MKGLNTNFNLSNGRFSLSEGKEKSRDAIWFYAIFDKFRIYNSEFGANFISLSQKPASYLVANRTIILGSLTRGIQKFVPSVNVKNIDIGYNTKDRRDYSMLIEYDSVLENKTKINDVIFV